MREYEQRHTPQRLLLKRALMAAAFIFLIVVVGAAWDAYGKERGTYEKRIEAESYLSGLKERERALRTQVARLKTEQGVEEEMRRQFELGREGEGVIVILEEEIEPAAEPVQQGWWPF